MATKAAARIITSPSGTSLLEYSAGWNASDPEIVVTGQPLATRTQREMITFLTMFHRFETPVISPSTESK